LLKKEGILKGSGRYEKLLAKLNESFGIRHDVWRDVITLDTERLPESIISSAEMDVVRRIKKYGEGLTRLTKEACKESLNRIKDMEASEAANLVKRALENFPDLSEDVFRIALGAKEDKRDFILDVIAIEAPEPLKRIEIDKAEKLAYEIKAPNAEAILFGRLASHYRDLANRDKKIPPRSS
jgi:vacuolar-type H+-ATPase subunit H